MSFLEKVEPYIRSNNKFVRDFALKAIEKSYLGTEHSFFLALEALDKIPANQMVNPIIPFTKNSPVTENIVKEVIKRLQKKDLNMFWYTIILAQCPSELLAKYQDTLKEFINIDALNIYTRLLPMNVEELFMEAAGVMNELERKEFDSSLYAYGKRIFRELIRRGEYNPENFYDIENGFEAELEEDYISINGIYMVFVAGEQRVTSLIEKLAGLLVRTEEDFLLEEVTDALIKIGTKEVLHEVEKYIENEDTAIAAVEIIGNIKHPDAETILLHHLEQSNSKTTKTFIAEALCLQLSVKAIPKIEALIEGGYDETMLNLTELLYPNCVINNVNHPKIQTWKLELEEKDAYWQNYKKEQILHDAKNKGIGRNDPCICGSGRKFKKCCG